LLTKPLCKGNGLDWKMGPKGKGYIFLPATNLQDLWIALQGTIDQVCDPASTEDYVKKVKGGEIIILPKVGHGFSVPRNWMPQFKTAFLRIVTRDKRDQPRESESITLKNLSPVEISPAIVRRSSTAVAFAPVRKEVGGENFFGSHLISGADKE
jgi:hypothetical protein